MEFLKQLMEKPAVQYLFRLYNNIENDYIGLLAAGVAFYFFLAAFPALGALISLYGLFSDPVFISDQLAHLSRFMPRESLQILRDQALSISESGDAALGLGVIVGIVLAIYGTTKGVKALIKGLNIANNTKETRNIVMLNYTAFTLTGGMMVYLLYSLSLVALLPAFLKVIFVPDEWAIPLLTLRWPLLILSAMIALQIIYHYAPSKPKDQPRRIFKWFSWGSFVATLFWVGGSSLFSLFVSNFGNYNETYGSLGAIVVLLLWFWLNALTILIGAEVNASFADDPAQDRKEVHMPK